MNKGKKPIKVSIKSEILANVKTFAIFFIMLVVIDLLFYVLTKWDIKTNFLILISVDVLLAATLSSIYILFDNIGFIISSIIIFFILFAYAFETALFGTYNTFMPFAAIINTAFDVLTHYGEESYKVIKHYILIVIFMLILFVLYILMLRLYEKNKKIANKSFALYTFIASFVLNITFMFFIKQTNDFSYNAFRYGLKAAFIHDVYGNAEKIKIGEKQVVISSSNTCNMYNIDFDKLNEEESDEDLKNINKYIASLEASNKNEYTGIFKDKNLILICAEAYSHYILDPVLTPTLWRLTFNGFRFNDFYVPSWGGSTSTGEFAFLTGLIPCDGPSSMKNTIGKNLCFTMPRVLKEAGYNTGSFHNGNYEYYDRHLTHGKNLGFDFYKAIGNGLEKIAGEWPTDEKMLVETFKTYYDKGPFCMYYMTISGHAFYNDRESFKVAKSIKKLKARYEDRYPEQVENYICYQIYLEDALKSLIDLLEEYDMIDNTVICMVSDHFPYGLSSEAFTDGKDYLPMLYGKNNMDQFDLDKNMPILWCGELENKYRDLNKDINEPTSTIDILPTLLNLFGAEYDSRLISGRDVFSDTEPLVMYSHGSFKNKSGKYLGYKMKFIPDNGEKVDKAEIDLYKEIVKNKILYSQYVVRCDYYNYLLGKEKKYE